MKHFTSNQPVITLFLLLSFSGLRSELPEYGTHMPPLLTVVTHTSGPILELGCGDFSTVLLHAACSATHRPLLSVENNQQWMNFFVDLTTDWHKFLFTKNWNTVGNDTQWSVVFVDEAPGEQRIVDIARLRKNADIFVVHDTENPGYKYSTILPKFKYSYTYTRYSTTTTVVSDTIDIKTFFG